MVRTNSKSLGNRAGLVSPEEERERLQRDGFAEKGGFKENHLFIRLLRAGCYVTPYHKLQTFILSLRQTPSCGVVGRSASSKSRHRRANRRDYRRSSDSICSRQDRNGCRPDTGRRRDSAIIHSCQAAAAAVSQIAVRYCQLRHPQSISATSIRRPTITGAFTTNDNKASSIKAKAKSRQCNRRCMDTMQANRVLRPVARRGLGNSKDPLQRKKLILDCISSVYISLHLFLCISFLLRTYLKVILCEFVNEIINILRDNI